MIDGNGVDEFVEIGGLWMSVRPLPAGVDRPTVIRSEQSVR
jgi:hypothetical protein